MGIGGENGEGFEDLVQQNFTKVNRLLSVAQAKKMTQTSRETQMLRLRTNSLRMANTAEEIEALEVDAVIARVQALKYEAECQKRIAEQDGKEYNNLRKKLIDLENSMYKYLDRMGGLRDEIQVRVDGLAVKIREYQRLEQEISGEINGLKERIAKADEKKQKADSWYYMLIPGYNIYLLADAYTDDDVKNLQNLKSRCEQISVERERLENELNAIENELQKDDTQLGKCTNELVNIQKAILKTVEDISNCGKEVGKWSDLYVLYGKMEQDIRIKGMKSEYAMKQIYV